MEADVKWSGWEVLIGVLFLTVIAVALWNLSKNNFSKARWLLFTACIIILFFTSLIIVPRIEKYSQGAAVDFFITRQGEDCYVDVLGYKSYAHLFYTMKNKPVNENYYNKEWLLKGDIDKPVYFVTKMSKIEKFQQYTGLKELYRKNGFIFLKREIPLPVQ